jgi:hypothetical protein
MEDYPMVVKIFDNFFIPFGYGFLGQISIFLSYASQRNMLLARRSVDENM